MNVKVPLAVRGIHPLYHISMSVYLPLLALTSLIHAVHRRIQGVGSDGPPGRLEMCCLQKNSVCEARSNGMPDLILAVCDVEGNFLVVKVGD